MAEKKDSKYVYDRTLRMYFDPQSQQYYELNK